MVTRAPVVWPHYILRCLESEISHLNRNLFGYGWKYPPGAFPFRYAVKATDFDRQSMPELVFVGKLPGEHPIHITCASLPQMFIQSPFYPCQNSIINEHISDMEKRFGLMCFDVTTIRDSKQ